MKTEHHFWDGEHDVYGDACNSRTYFAHGDAKVNAFCNAIVIADGNANVWAYDRANVFAMGEANVAMVGDGTVYATGNSKVCFMGRGIVFGTGHSTIYTRVGVQNVHTFEDSKFVLEDDKEKENNAD